ncbi:hypothetical protein [Nocardiopsis sp. CNT312]|uniref:hypothetical protein n=1 Tax=Nocardiopsis sp. CNT312 TaxID=1137268 RepID=UPI0012DFD384|nr:hypothetical protein [Nocardiopsis sp. CNT312]
MSGIDGGLYNPQCPPGDRVFSKFNIWHERVSEEFLEKIFSPVQEVSLAGWRWPREGGKIFMGEKLVINIGPAMKDVFPWDNDPGFWEVNVGSRSLDDFSHINGIDCIDWRVDEN